MRWCNVTMKMSKRVTHETLLQDGFTGVSHLGILYGLRFEEGIQESHARDFTTQSSAAQPRYRRSCRIFSSTDSISRREIAAFFAEGKLAYNFAEPSWQKGVGPDLQEAWFTITAVAHRSSPKDPFLRKDSVRTTITRNRPRSRR
jgi:hypothetical protein